MGYFKLQPYEDQRYIYEYKHLGNNNPEISWIENGLVKGSTTYNTDIVERFLSSGTWVKVNTKQDTLKLIKKHLWNQE